MSTIGKLDPNVRLDRTLRKEQRRALQRDIANGPEPTRRVLAIVLDHVSKICKDPSRTGAKKDEILSKLGAPKS